MSKQSRLCHSIGKKTILRPFNSEKDIDLTVKWLNDPEIRDLTMMTLPVNRDQHSKWVEQIAASDADEGFIIETLDNVTIGYIGIHRINWIDRTATTSCYIGDKSYWSKGCGTDAKMQLAKFSFHDINLRKLNAEAIEYNIASVKHNQNIGFQIEGEKKKQVFVRGQYWDLVQLGLFREDWELKYKKWLKP